MATFTTLFGTVSEMLAPMWVEISFMLFFALGFIFFPRSRHDPKHKKGEDKSQLLYKQIDADATANNSVAVLKTWDSVKALAPAPLETLKCVVQVLLDSKGDVCGEVVEHFASHGRVLKNAKFATGVLDVVARAGRADLLDQLAQEFKVKLGIRHTFQTYEVLLGGHASAGNDKRALEICAEINESNQRLTARGYSLTIKGFLKNAMVDSALRQIKAMHQQGFVVPPFAVAQLFRTACQNDRGVEIFEASCETLQIPQEAVIVLLEDCQKRNDLDLALRIEKLTRASDTALPVSAYDSLLKICVIHANIHALQLFKDMQKEGLRISEGL